MHRPQIHSNQPQVLCAGLACLDQIFQVPEHPGPDDKLKATSLKTCGGGPAFNAAWVAASLGGDVSFAGYLGNDWAGELLASEMQEAGVRMDPTFWGPQPTPIASVFVKPDGLRSVVHFAGNDFAIPQTAIEPYVETSSAILIDPHRPTLVNAVLEIANNRGVPVILDAGSLNKDTQDFAKRVQFLAASRIFARDLAGSNTPADMIRALGELNESALVTLGPDGVVWKTPEGNGQLPAYEVVCKDSTGAGDAFHGAFALAVARRYSLANAIAFAQAAGAFTCRYLGGRGKAPKIEDLEEIAGKRFSRE